MQTYLLLGGQLAGDTTGHPCEGNEGEGRWCWGQTRFHVAAAGGSTVTLRMQKITCCCFNVIVIQTCG